MVKLSLLSRSNSNSRYFPHSGYLGLTPVVVEGLVRTHNDGDNKPLRASHLHVSVKCIESRLGRLGSVHSNVLAEYTSSLWKKPATDDWADLTDSEHPFRITIPVDTPGPSSATFQDYRVFWRVEAVVEHIQTFGVGTRQLKSYELPLVRYDAPHIPPPYQPTYISSTPTKSSRLGIHYKLGLPSRRIGPLETLEVPITLRPLDVPPPSSSSSSSSGSSSSYSVRAAHMIVERRIVLHDASCPPSPETDYLDPLDWTDSTSVASSSRPLLGNHAFMSNGNGAYGMASCAGSAPGGPNQDCAQKTISFNVAGADSRTPFVKDETGAFHNTLSLQWPAPKSNSRWAMGETMQTDLISVRFFLQVKVVVSSVATGAETIHLDEQEIFTVATSHEQRKEVLRKYRERRSRSKSKSPRRAGGGKLPSPPTTPDKDKENRKEKSKGKSKSKERQTWGQGEHPIPYLPASVMMDTLHPTGVSAPPPKTRRPHTSAGPSSRKTRSGTSGSGESSHGKGDVRPVTAQALMKSYSEQAVRGTVDPGKVRAWEEELERIERASRRSSADMLGFSKAFKAAR